MTSRDKDTGPENQGPLDAPRRGLPLDLSRLMRAREELVTFRWIVRRLYADHQRMAQRCGFDRCLCSLCQQARPFIPAEPRHCAGQDERMEGS